MRLEKEKKWRQARAEKMEGIYGVFSGQRKDENGRSDSTEERRNKSSLASSRQSSEYYAGDSTVKFIWQVCGKFLTSDFARAYFSL